MTADRYEFLSDRFFLNFEFVSDGPKGKFKKFVQFSPENANGTTYFNWSFGDWNEEKMGIDDRKLERN